MRDDLAGELAHYCVNALGAAADLPSEAAVHRLVRLTMAGLRTASQSPKDVSAAGGPR